MTYTYNDHEFDLTEVQIHLIESMLNGWLVQHSNEPSDKRCWKIRNGVEHTIYAPTIRALEEKGIIKQDNAKPVGTYDFVD